MEFSSIKRMFRILSISIKQFPLAYFIVLIAIVFGGILEAFSLISLLPLLATVLPGAGVQNEGSGNGVMQIYEYYRTAFSWLGVEMTLPSVLILIVLIMFFKGGCAFITGFSLRLVAANLVRDMRLSFLEYIFSANWSYFMRNANGRFTNSISSEAIRSATSYLALWTFLATVIQLVILTAVSLVFPIEVLFGAFVLGGLIWFILLPAQKLAKRAGVAETKSSKSLMSAMTDKLQGMKALKAMGREHLVRDYLNVDVEHLWRAHKSQGVAVAAQASLPEPIMTAIIALGLYVALEYTGTEFSELLVMIVFFNRMIGKISELQRTLQAYHTVESAYWSMFDSIEEAKNSVKSNLSGTDKVIDNTKIVFKNVSFSYPNSPVLFENLSLELPETGLVSFTGPSGGGKTTVIDLITGLVRPTSGDILIGGKKLSTIDMPTWRSRIGYVPQEVLLFNDSIRSNLTLGDDAIGDQDLVYAIEQIDGWSFVESLDQQVGERGALFSGGQRQRLMIARALVGKPSVLILDEATAALDENAEIKISNMVKRLSGDMLVIAVSHQKYMLSLADMVLEMNKGRVEPWSKLSESQA